MKCCNEPTQRAKRVFSPSLLPSLASRAIQDVGNLKPRGFYNFINPNPKRDIQTPTSTKISISSTACLSENGIFLHGDKAAHVSKPSVIKGADDKCLGL